MNCRRIGTARTGGHCLICGYDIAPYAGIVIGPEWIVCASGGTCHAQATVYTAKEFEEYRNGYVRHYSETVTMCQRIKNSEAALL